MTKRNALLFLLISPLLAGCAAMSEPKPVSPAPQIEEKQAFPYYRLAPTAPPENPKEIIPESQNPMNEIWQAGFWSYDGKIFRWNPGYYMPRPAPTAAWSQTRWAERSFGWAFVPGHWY